MSKPCSLDVDKLAKIVAAQRSTPCDLMKTHGRCLTPNQAIRILSSDATTIEGARRHVEKVLRRK